MVDEINIFTCVKPPGMFVQNAVTVVHFNLLARFIIASHSKVCTLLAIVAYAGSEKPVVLEGIDWQLYAYRT